MTRVDAKCGIPTGRAGWLLGPVVVSYRPDQGDDEASAQARELASVAAVDLKMVSMKGAFRPGGIQ